MRIISKFHDYYDCICRYGIDKSVVFVREQKTVECPDCIAGVGPLPDNLLGEWIGGIIRRATPFYIFFCGQVIRGVRIEHENSGYFILHARTFLYTSEQVEKHMRDKWGKVFTQSDRDLVLSWLEDSVPGHGRVYIPYALNFRNNVLYDYALRQGVPYFLVSCFTHDEGDRYYQRVTLLPNLKDLSFMKAMTPQDAFSKIQSFITSDLVKERVMKIDPVSDKVKVESHGFDKWSFRREPSKR